MRRRARRRLVLAVLVLAGLLPVAAAPQPAPVALPPPRKEGTVSVEAALAARRSLRAYAKAPLTLAEVGQLLWAAQGVTGPDGRRTAPSARNLHPLELAVVAQEVEGLPRGAYRYLPARHALTPLARPKGATDALLAPATSQASVQAAPAVFVVAAVYGRMDAGPRSRTWADYEAGLASENLLLQAVALGLGGVVVGGMDPAAAHAAVGFTDGEEVVVLVPVGRPAPPSPP